MDSRSHRLAMIAHGDSDAPGSAVVRAADGLRRIVQALRVSSHGIEKRHGVSGAQLFVLQEVARSDGPSLNQLAERTRTDPSSVSVAVSRLCAGGYLRRKQSPDDARKAVVRLTAKGEALLSAAPEPAQARVIRALEGLRPADAVMLARVLEQVARSIGAPGGAPPMFFEERKRGAARPVRKKRGTRGKT